MRRYLFIGLVLFFVFEYFRPGYYFPLIRVFHINTLIPILVFMGAVLLGNGRSNTDLCSDRNSKILGYFLALLILSVLTAELTFNAYQVLKWVFGYFLMYFAIARIIDSVERLKTIFLTLIIIHIILVILYPQIILDPETRSYIGGVTFLGDGNDFALSILITMPMCTFLIQDADSKWVRIFYFVILLFLILCIIGTSSRGASIGLVAIFLYNFAKSRNKTRLGLVAVVFLCVVVVYAPPMYYERFQLIKDYESEGSTKGRLMAWGSAVRMANDYPLLGVGAGSFPVKFGTTYRPPGYGRTELPWHNAHSIYFQVLGELGYPGLLFLLWFFWSNYRRNESWIRKLSGQRGDEVERLRKLVIANNSSMISFAVSGAFLTAIYYPHLYILAAFMTTTSYLGHLTERVAAS